MVGQIQYAPLSTISLDPRNLRLARDARRSKLSAEQIYDLMRDWSLEELATSFLESGFWTHEAVLCVKEKLDGRNCLVVVEGNRRIAALMCLQRTYDGVETTRKWRDLIGDVPRPDELFENVPYILVDSRKDIDAFLGFRHVTGIKEWAPPQKAEFIAKLIEEDGLSYREVMRKIGSRTDTVQRNYIAFCILSQMEDTDGIDTNSVENRFSVLFLSLRNRAIQDFLGVKSKFNVDPNEVAPPIGGEHIGHLREYAKWLFGHNDIPAVVKDSRDVDRFARILASDDGLAYMRSVKRPDLEHAFVISGGDKEELNGLLISATYTLQQALSTIYLYKGEERITEAARKLIAATEEIRRTLELD